MDLRDNRLSKQVRTAVFTRMRTSSREKFPSRSGEENLVMFDIVLRPPHEVKFSSKLAHTLEKMAELTPVCSCYRSRLMTEQKPRFEIEFFSTSSLL